MRIHICLLSPKEANRSREKGETGDRRQNLIMIRMENYNQMAQENTNNRNKDDRSDLPPYAATPLLMTTTNFHHHHMNEDGGGDGSGGDYFQSALVVAATAAAAVAAEDDPNDNIVKSESSQQQQQPARFYNYPWLMSSHPSDHHDLHLHQRHREDESRQEKSCDLLGVGGGRGGGSDNDVHNRSSGGDDDRNELEVMKAKITAHPKYCNLLQAYTDCQKVGAPPEVAARLTAILEEFEIRHRISSSSASSSKDHELDQFMEAYYDMLVKYREDLTRPVQEAMEFMARIESQLSLLTIGRDRSFASDEKSDGNIGSSEEEQENSGGEAELPEIDPRAEDRELKNHLLRKYSGYLSSLEQELSKKKKKGKLPKEARQKLLSWWELHYKWPYPSESEKAALAEATGLDQKQINNWFINQRKRHWKPSEDMRFMVMDGIHPQSSALHMGGHYLGNGPYRFST